MTLQTYDDIEQRSDRWYALRCGILTASAIGQLINVTQPDALDYPCPGCEAVAGEPCKSKRGGAPTKIPHAERSQVAAENPDELPARIGVAENDTARGLVLSLAAERITGPRPEDSWLSGDMIRGIEHEPFARDAYAESRGPVDEVGFMVRTEDAWTLGVSPDGLVGDVGGIEIKCPRPKNHLATVLTDEVPSQHMAQIQAALLVTGRDWWDFISFVDGLPLYVKRVLPDPAWRVALVAAAEQFESNVAAMVAAYEKATTGLAPTERVQMELVI